MRLAVFLSVLFHSLAGRQNDTLLTRILSLRSDTEKVNQLYLQGFSLRNTNPRLAFYYANLSEERAHVSGSKQHLAKSYNLLGILFYKKGDFTKALAYHQKALALRTECKDGNGMAISHTNLGNIYTDLQLFEKAEQAYMQALEIYKELGDEKRAGDCLINMGVLKQTLKQNETAFENYVVALKLAEKINDYQMRALCLNNMAQVFFDKGSYEKSIAYNEGALKLRNRMDNNLEVADSYLNLASNYIKVRDFEKARECLDTAYTIAKTYRYYAAVQHAFRMYSEYYAALRHYEQAYYWLNRHQLSKDSITAEQSTRASEFDFEEPEITGYKLLPETQKINNLWLLVSVLVLAVIIPLFLIRFKR